MHRKTRGRVAQLDRVLASEAKGRGFDPRSAHHKILRNQPSKSWFLFFMGISPGARKEFSLRPLLAHGQAICPTKCFNSFLSSGIIGRLGALQEFRFRDNLAKSRHMACVVK